MSTLVNCPKCRVEIEVIVTIAINVVLNCIFALNAMCLERGNDARNAVSR